MGCLGLHRWGILCFCWCILHHCGIHPGLYFGRIFCGDLLCEDISPVASDIHWNQSTPFNPVLGGLRRSSKYPSLWLDSRLPTPHSNRAGQFSTTILLALLHPALVEPYIGSHSSVYRYSSHSCGTLFEGKPFNEPASDFAFQHCSLQWHAPIIRQALGYIGNIHWRCFSDPFLCATNDNWGFGLWNRGRCWRLATKGLCWDLQSLSVLRVSWLAVWSYGVSDLFQIYVGASSQRNWPQNQL